MRHLARGAIFLFLAGLPGLAHAGDAAIRATAGKPVQIGYYSVLRNDCSGGAVPKFKISGEPQHGIIVVKPATLKTKRLAACGTVQAPAVVVIYQARTEYAGTDAVSFSIVNPETGQSEPHSFSISVLSAQTTL